jgi:hypothetical protein
MKPDAGEMLAQIAQTLLAEVAPRISGEYEQRSALLLGLMLTALAEEWDRGAARRVEENAALRRLFAEAVPTVRDPALRAKIAQAADSTDADLSMRSLARGNEGLRALLIDLHAAIESDPSTESRRLENRVWDELVASTERRRLSISMF